MDFFTGCSSLHEIDDVKVKDVSDIITQALINTAGQEKAEKKESHTLAATDKKAFNLIGSVGDISITSHQSDDTIININIRSSAGTREKAEDTIENYTYTISEENNAIEVDTSFEKPLNGINLSVDLEIYIPSTINDIKISTNVGDIQLSGIIGNIDIKSNVGEALLDKSEGSYNLNVDVGDIRLEDCKPIGNSNFHTNTGDMKFSLDITKSDTITAETGVGDIEMAIKADKGYHAVINEFMEDERVEKKGDPNTQISLKTGVGKISFND